MRALTLIVCAALLGVACAKLSTEQYQQHFVDYLARFPDKQYGPDEMFYRFSVFKQNLDLVNKHNAEADAGKHSFRLAMNKFGDWTNDEYRGAMLNLKRKASSTRPAGDFASTYDAARVAALPPALDWREKGIVTPVKDQGQCGSCWAFSATAAMEGAHAQATGKLISLSEQLCVDCVDGGADNCNVGGEMHDCYLEVIKLGGDESEASYPYQGTSGEPCKFKKSLVVATFTSYSNISMLGNETSLQVALDAHVISIGIDASSIWFQLYSFGVYDDSSCQNGWDDLDHGVTAVGWGHDDASGKDFWIVKNSWGADWGLSGYIWMVRNKGNQCGVATDATWPIV